MLNGQIINVVGLGIYNNAYDKSRWNFKSLDGITDTAKNSWVRAPSKLQIEILEDNESKLV